MPCLSWMLLTMPRSIAKERLPGWIELMRREFASGRNKERLGEAPGEEVAGWGRSQSSTTGRWRIADPVDRQSENRKLTCHLQCYPMESTWVHSRARQRRVSSQQRVVAEVFQASQPITVMEDHSQLETTSRRHTSSSQFHHQDTETSYGVKLPLNTHWLRGWDPLVAGYAGRNHSL